MTSGIGDLRTDAWVPVISKTRRDDFGLVELFLRAHEITDLAIGLPPAASGLRRILTLLAARFTGLDVPGGKALQWNDRRNDILTGSAGFDEQRVLKYFEQYRDRFDLFHPERPWLQDPRLVDECSGPAGLNRLILDRPAGNNQPWMAHHTDSRPNPIPASEAALHLVGQLYYGAPGKCTARTVSDRRESNSTSGPVRGLVSYHPRGNNLFESLVAGIPFPAGADSTDRAPWESDSLPNPLGIPSPPRGLAGMLTNRFRHAILLVPSPARTEVVDAYMTWGWRELHPAAEDPYLIYQTSKKGESYARHADGNRALWRDLDGLLLQDIAVAGRRRPAVLDQAVHLPLEVLTRLRVVAHGFDQDRAQVSDRQWYTATTPASVLTLLTEPATAAAVSRMRETAERLERHLRAALRNVWVAINDPSNGKGKPARTDISVGPWPELAANLYWPEAERVFYRRVHARDFDGAAKELRDKALDAYNRVTGQIASRPRAARAIELSRGYIFAAVASSSK
ncbi:type I-E CRISPR-associated protein Cse1/CasA [Nocardia tengchongensis]|uniref:type I-E CRISPR-associated protein Cse1/CasA n=1 Tax=Nocardia tengchongensis TaxID=2055889 RepID=UPI0036981845